MTTDRETREELRRLEAAATPGPWISEYSGKTGPVVIDGESRNALDHVAKCSHYRDHADAVLIAAMRNALPALLDATDRAEDPDRVSMSRHDYQRLLDARDAAADRADAETARADAAEAERDSIQFALDGARSVARGDNAYLIAERDAALARVAKLESRIAGALAETRRVSPDRDRVDVSCGGWSVNDAGCFAADVAARVRAALSPEGGKR